MSAARHCIAAYIWVLAHKVVLHFQGLGKNDKKSLLKGHDFLQTKARAFTERGEEDALGSHAITHYDDE